MPKWGEDDLKGKETEQQREGAVRSDYPAQEDRVNRDKTKSWAQKQKGEL